MGSKDQALLPGSKSLQELLVSLSCLWLIFPAAAAIAETAALAGAAPLSEI